MRRMAYIVRAVLVGTGIVDDLRRLWARWNRFVDAVGDWTDGLAERFGDWAARAFDRAWFGAAPHCDGCGRRGGMLYAMPAAIKDDGLPGFVLRCDSCRTLWHQAIRDYYTRRAADAAAARFDRERREAA